MVEPWRDVLLEGTCGEASIWRFADNISWKLENGMEIVFWRDKWLGDEPFCELFSHLYETKSDQRMNIADSGFWFSDKWIYDWSLGWKWLENPLYSLIKKKSFS